eukprot:1431287-Lingulodinium_polyedra.AAC.1
MALPLGQITLDANSAHLMKIAARHFGCRPMLRRMLGFVGPPIDLNAANKKRYIEIVVLLPVLNGCIPHDLQTPAQTICNLLGFAMVTPVDRGRGLQTALPKTPKLDRCAMT